MVLILKKGISRFWLKIGIFEEQLGQVLKGQLPVSQVECNSLSSYSISKYWVFIQNHFYVYYKIDINCHYALWEICIEGGKMAYFFVCADKPKETYMETFVLSK
jgi:hypothetical protein